MAKTTRKPQDISEEVESVVVDEVYEEPQEELQEEPMVNLDQQVTIKSIATWNTGFARLLGVGDVSIPAKGSVRLTRNEVISQIQNGNSLFNGIDGFGNHATLLICDEPTKKYVGFEKAIQFSDAAVKKIFDIYSQSEFESQLQNLIVTRAEKRALMASIRNQKLNDFSKIRFCEKYTGLSLDKLEQIEKENR